MDPIRKKYKELMLKKFNQEIKELHKKEIELRTRIALLLSNEFSDIDVHDFRPHNLNLITYSTDLGWVDESL